MKRKQLNKAAGFKLMVVLVLLSASCKKESGQSDSSFLQGEDQNSLSSISRLALCAPIPDSLAVPAGNKLVLQTFATGVQIYEVKRSTSDAGGFAWVNIAPSATLYAREDFTKPVVEHFAGPSWQFIKGADKEETVVASRAAGVTVDNTAIQWLLLQAVPDRSTAGNKVTFIQRVCTVGGLAPTTEPTELNLGQKDSIPYQAIYLFYEKE
jgi:hypothetical protein